MDGAGAPSVSLARRGAVLGSSVAGGWVLHDLLVFAGSGDPAAFLGAVPLSLLGVCAVALVGASSARVRLLPWILAVLALAASPRAIAAVVLPEQVSILLPRMVALLLMALGAAGLVPARWRIGPVRLGLCVGLLAAFGHAFYQWRLGQVPFGGMTIRSMWPAAGVACAALFAGAIPRFLPRSGITLLLVLVLVPRLQRGPHRLGPERMRPDLGAPTAVASEGARSLVLVVLDTVRADHLSCYGYDRPTTPGLDAFAREHATRYTQARSTSPFTLPSHASLFTGLLPAEHGTAHPSTWCQPLDTPEPTIAERLRERGYRTGALVANCGYLTVPLRMDRGFEHFDNRGVAFLGEYMALAQALGWAAELGRSSTAPAERITDRALRWLEQVPSGAPYFLMLNYLDVHYPYRPPADRAGLFEDEPRPGAPNPAYWRAKLLYDRELHYLDEHVARLLEHLEAREGWDDTVVVVTADHGEALGDHGFPDHCWSLYDAMVRVPLLVKPAGGRTRLTVDEPIHGAQVHDLMLELLGLEVPHRPPERRLFAEWYPQRPVAEIFPEFAAVHDDLDADLVAFLDGSIKTIVSSTGKVEAYDVLRDPRELSPLPLSPEEVQAALQAARAWWSERPVTPAKGKGRQAAVDLQVLRGLGYAGS